MNRARFPKEKHQNSQKWAKFTNFSLWPFLWFGLLGRLLNFLRKSRFTRFRGSGAFSFSFYRKLTERPNLVHFGGWGVGVRKWRWNKLQAIFMAHFRLLVGPLDRLSERSNQEEDKREPPSPKLGRIQNRQQN